LRLQEFLLDFHTRAHRSLQGLLKHCHNLTEKELNQELEGFGFPTIQLQLDHIVGAEQYWIGVLKGSLDDFDDSLIFPSLESLETYRDEVFNATELFLTSTTTAELETVRPMMTWGKVEKNLSPLQVIIRTQTHIYQHQGQILAMCRLFGKPCSGLDYPID
jgi:uncharacterized damage-inducible protein DinB